MDIFTVITMLGGLAMFLYGMEIMGDGLKSSSSKALKSMLEKVTQSVILGVVTGTLVTAVIQSSTATIVLTVGLLSAGILNLRQSISIVMGANIGTTITAQLIRLMDIDSGGSMLLTFFKPDTLAPIAMITAIILLMFIKKKKTNGAGTMLMGFGLLFTGLMLMSDSVAPLADSPAFVDVIQRFSDMPLLGILTGLVTTFIIQSSSAMIGIVQALSSTGAFTFNVVYPIIMGINLGTCVTTAIVCSIGTNKDAKRTGFAHIVFNVIGTILFMIAMTLFHRFGVLGGIWDKVVDSGDIANFATIFNLATAIVLIPFANQLVKLTTVVIKDNDDDPDEYPEIRSLDEKLFISPPVALHQVNVATVQMAELARKNFRRSIMQLSEYTPERAAKIATAEDRLDGFTDAAENYLIRLSNHIESDEDTNDLNLLLQAVTDFERIGDYASRIDELSQRLVQEGLSFSETARKELALMTDALLEIIDTTVTAFSTEDEDMAKKIEPLEEVIDEMVATLKDRHIIRLKNGSCTISAGLVFIETLTHMGRAADQCSSIAVFLMGRRRAEILSNHHAYLHELHKGNDADYAAEFAAKREQYLSPIHNI
ncbi:MAG: Na/Pi cotransporter family protein [Clostridia bacterium]|nr:Na/Pi cotransporter family protein [Clostridia bacterium]